MSGPYTSTVWIEGEPNQAVQGRDFFGQIRLRSRAAIRFKRICRVWPVFKSADPAEVAHLCEGVFAAARRNPA